MIKPKQNSYRRIFFLLALILIQISIAFAQNAVKIDLDATEAARNILHVKEIMPVKAGELTLFYPKWIPGEHAPTGPINNMVNLFITANGKPLAWRRDDVEMFAFHLTIPTGVKEINIAFDDVSEPATTMSASLARIKWNRLTLYPQGVKSDDLQVTASLNFPADWQYATALPVAGETKNAVNFKAVNFTTFVDSPAIIGKYFKKIPLGDANGAMHEIDIAADSAEALEYKAETLQGWKNLVKEANLLFGARHYNNYKFLLTLSDVGGSEGLEHHESSEDGVGEKSLSDEYRLIDLGDLLGHEFTHSWNGKYRRPASLTTADFEQPMQGEFLWVYEGLTQYLGHVLPTRSGLWTPEVYRETLAADAASLDNQTGRRWRPLVDTARAVQFTYGSPRAWRNQRRGVDYYDEGALIWLEADVLIRQKSGGKKSLDDFLKKFHGGQNTAPKVVTYDLNEVVKTLNEVQPNDWRGFFTERIYNVQKNAPLGGITNGGWKLIYNEMPNTYIKLGESISEGTNLFYSIGIFINKDGIISDINPDLSAAKAGLAPGMTIKKINGEDFSAEELHKAVVASKSGTPIEIVAENGGSSQTYKLDYKGGERYPHLERDASKTDYLSEIVKSDLYGFIISGPIGRTKIHRAQIVNEPANVTKVILNQTEITMNCATNLNVCKDEKRIIEISTEAADKEGDVLTYNYTVSAGKIIGQGANVVWNLSGAAPGSYTITAGVDDGCGFCGMTKTKTVVVKECPDCQ